MKKLLALVCLLSLGMFFGCGSEKPKVSNPIDAKKVLEDSALKMDELKKTVGEAGEVAKEGVEKVGEAAKEGAEKVGEAAKEGAEAVKEGAEKAKEEVKEGAEKVGEAVKEAAKEDK